MRYLIFFLFFIFPYNVFANKIYISPPKGEFEINKNFTLAVYIDSNQEVNAIGGKIVFDNKYLKVINIATKDSVLTFWAVKPNFDNNKGEINFEGVKIEKPFGGSQNKILEIIFKGIKETEKTELRFENVQILAADGQGTNIFKTAVNGSYKIYKKIIEEQTKEPLIIVQKETLPTPNIISPSHPNQNKWYNNNNPEFEWQLPQEVKKVRLILSTNPNAYPSIIYLPPINSRKVKNLDDGIYYFRLIFENEKSISNIATYKVMIDTTPPQLEIKKLPKELIYESPKFEILAKDNLSEINYFEVYINNKLITTTKNSLLDLEDYNLGPGEYLLSVKAFDLANNYSYQTIDFEIGKRDILTERKILKTELNIIEISKNILIMVFILLVLTLILILFYFKNRRLKKQIEEKIKEIEMFVNKSFILLKKDLEKQLEILETKHKEGELIEEEKKLIEHIKKHLKNIDEFIKKNISEIEKFLK